MGGQAAPQDTAGPRDGARSAPGGEDVARAADDVAAVRSAPAGRVPVLEADPADRTPRTVSDRAPAVAPDAGPRATPGVGPPARPVAGATNRPTSPAPARWFFGRQRELKALHSDIERAGLNTIAGRRAAHTRVLLIAGQRGAGRTALARELARQVGRRYPDGVLHIRLTEPGGEPVPVERTARDLLGEFDIPAPPGAGEDELSEMVRAALAERRVLLLLDDAHDAEQVDLLLPENPDCLVVAVARGPLTGIPDIRPCTVGGLDAKSAIELLGTFTGSVRITVDPQAAETLAEECAGQPVALCLVGGWLATHPRVSVADATKRLCAVPEDVELPRSARPLARAFRFVYGELPPSTAAMLRLLALAPAGFADAHTASALSGCSVSAATAALDDLAALSLLRPAGDQFEIPGSLAPLMRALMETHDRPAEVQLATARMLERTVRLLQSCRAVTEPEGSPARMKLAALPRAVRFPTTRAAAEWLSSRRPALLASARLAVADGGLDTLARRLVSALVRALAAHQGTDAAAPDLYGLHQLVLGVAERQGLHREEAAALLNIGDLDARTGRTHDALARYRSALDAGKAANDHYATGRAMESVGSAYQELQDWHRAADWYGRALAQRLSRGERAEEARLYGRLGTVHTYAGRYGEALRHWRAAAAGFRRLQDLTGQARALSEAARVQEYAGRPEDSLHTCQEAVEWARLAGDTPLQAELELRLADTLERLGDPTAARLHRKASDRLLATTASAYEIRSTSAED
ncbi:tetratricopeptide repeat protein [Streptomyces sp. IB2014 016-6]|uniref:tetratricopeptide repeat protein n=1 Tax=Streptomyces sp. IB2014 016-6 TaxID=2517818 RepID=UPI001F4FCF3C|nr:tetratricopeptide repeat protein [Streptomyces sp. IB2014 016-6]